MPAPFEDFVADRGPAPLRFAYLLTGDGGLAEALVQEALIRSYRRWHGRLDAEHPEAYVRRIVVNEYVSWRRRSSGELPGLGDEVGATAEVHAEVADLVAAYD